MSLTVAERMKARSDPSVIGIVIYDGVEPIDIGGTVGVISMASRILPALRYAVIAERTGPIRLASGLVILADADFDTAPACDTYIVAGGPGWREQVNSGPMLEFLRCRAPQTIASVCTGALILAASGQLAGKTATTRRNAIGSESDAPLTLLAKSGSLQSTPAASVVEHAGVITSGGVSLAIDGTLYILGRLYGENVCAEIASVIEYDRAYAANRDALGHVRIGFAS